MAKIVRLKGINNVMRNINRELSKIKGRSIGGMVLAAAHIRRDMDQTPPLIPVDTGNLRASWFVHSATSAGQPLVTMGFSASYAAAVEKSKRFKQGKRPNSGPRFFESSLDRNHKNIIRIIAANAKRS